MLQQIEFQFRQLVEHVGDVIYRYRLVPTEGFSYISPAIQRILGYTAEEFYADPGLIYRLLCPDDLPRVQALLTDSRLGRTASFRARHRDGRVVWLEQNNVTICDEDGRVIACEGITRDITKRQQGDPELAPLLHEVERRAAELDAVVAAIPDGIIVFAASGKPIGLNPAAERMLGHSLDEFALDTADRIALLGIETPDGESLKVANSPAIRALQGEMVEGFQMVLHPRSGKEIWISAGAAPIRTPNGRVAGSVVSFTDITAQHELQQDREDLLHTVSHDLRTPLTVIQGQAQLLLRLLKKSAQGGPEQRSAQAIFISSQRMAAMIRDLVDSARLESGQLGLQQHCLNLPDFLQTMLQQLAGVLETERVRVQAHENLPMIVADPDRLERVLTNLLSNALKYSDPGTDVTVTVSQKDSHLLVSISDKGQGIPPEDLPRLFQRFRRTAQARERREGLGLGLYITRRLVEAHGGTVWADSKPGAGSTFSFTIPVAPTDLGG